MDLRHIDYISVSGRSRLHRMPAGVKMLGLVLFIGVLLWVDDAYILGAAAAAVLLIALAAGLPMRVFLPLTLYPLFFLVIIFVSIRDLTLISGTALVFRVLAITGSVVTLFLTTSYPAVFGTLSKMLPGFLIAALFFTYRSVFVISDTFNNIRTALHLRGGMDRKHPVLTLSRLGMALGHFLAHSIESSENMADSLRVRGFANRIYNLGGKYE